ncbi:MAG: DUF309 domain-containing protein [Desulfobacteraceae bacterium]|nr:DUF309 domain-containing protein [Desulfobacteraceae bacterium]
MDSIHKGDMGPSQSVAETLRRDHAHESCLEPYIDNRITRYQAVIARIRSANISIQDTYAIALLLWDQGLFFEVHEWIEGKWLQAKGTEKSLLQALIRGAGTYVLLEAGREERAGKMAAKALPPMIQHKALVPGFFNVDLLIASLEALDPVPPKLGGDQLTGK